MFDNKIKPATLLLALGVMLGATLIALAVFVFTMQKTTPAQPFAAPPAVAGAASNPSPTSPSGSVSASTGTSAASSPNRPETKGTSTSSISAADQNSAQSGQSEQSVKPSAFDAPPQTEKKPVNINQARTVDCFSPARNYEKIICSDDELLELDAKLAAVYKRSRSRSEDPDYVRDAQRDWERGVRNICESDTCLIKAYKRRIAVLTDRFN